MFRRVLGALEESCDNYSGVAFIIKMFVVSSSVGIISILAEEEAEEEG